MAVARSKVMLMPIAWGKMRVEVRIQPRTASAGPYLETFKSQELGTI